MANDDDGSCSFPVDEYGDTGTAPAPQRRRRRRGVRRGRGWLHRQTACNYDASATDDDASRDDVLRRLHGIRMPTTTKPRPSTTVLRIAGQTYPTAANYNPDATIENGTCTLCVHQPAGHQLQPRPTTTVPASSLAARSFAVNYNPAPPSTTTPARSTAATRWPSTRAMGHRRWQALHHRAAPTRWRSLRPRRPSHLPRALGCTNPTADNHNPDANNNDGSWPPADARCRLRPTTTRRRPMTTEAA